MPLQYKLFCSVVLEKSDRREQVGYLSEINCSSRHFKHSTNWPSTLVTLDLSPKMDANPIQPFPQHFAKLLLHFTGIQQGGERKR